MKVGSLVILVDDNWTYKHLNTDEYPIKRIIYTVRRIVREEGILLEEIINPKRQFAEGFLEKCFSIARFREIQSPDEINIEALLMETIQMPVHIGDIGM